MDIEKWSWLIALLTYGSSSENITINNELYKNLSTVSGILAGFSISAGVQILSSFDRFFKTGSKKSNGRPHILDVVTGFYCSGAILIGVFISFSIIESYSAPLPSNADTRYLIILILLGYLSTLYLFFGVIKFLCNLIKSSRYWGQKVTFTTENSHSSPSKTLPELLEDINQKKGRIRVFCSRVYQKIIGSRAGQIIKKALSPVNRLNVNKPLMLKQKVDTIEGSPDELPGRKQLEILILADVILACICIAVPIIYMLINPTK